MADRRYEVPVANLQPDELAETMKRSLAAVQRELPKGTGVIVFAFDFGQGGGLSYISNANREDAIRMLQEWIRNVRSRA